MKPLASGVTVDSLYTNNKVTFTDARGVTTSNSTSSTSLSILPNIQGTQTNFGTFYNVPHIAFDYTVIEPHARTPKAKAYADNFKYDRVRS